jgi:hypothetical protein
VPELKGFEEYSAIHRTVKVSTEGAHTLLAIEDGAAMLTPAQARAVGRWLHASAASAENVEHTVDCEPEKGPDYCVGHA